MEEYGTGTHESLPPPGEVLLPDGDSAIDDLMLDVEECLSPFPDPLQLDENEMPDPEDNQSDFSTMDQSDIPGADLHGVQMHQEFRSRATTENHTLYSTATVEKKQVPTTHMSPDSGSSSSHEDANDKFMRLPKDGTSRNVCPESTGDPALPLSNTLSRQGLPEVSRQGSTVEDTSAKKRDSIYKKVYKNPELVEKCILDFKKNKATDGRERPFSCPWCAPVQKKPYEFATLETLVNHSFVHLQEDPYVCRVEGCEKRFRARSGLFSHNKTHGADKVGKTDPK